MATKKDATTRKAPAAPGATQAGTAAGRAGQQQAQREPQQKAREPQRAAQKEPVLENKGSSRGATSRKSPDEIALRAYQRWQQRGAPHGGDQEDWLEAERELDGASRH